MGIFTIGIELNTHCIQNLEIKNYPIMLQPTLTILKPLLISSLIGIGYWTTKLVPVFSRFAFTMRIQYFDILTVRHFSTF